jgi:hypothetical protein
VGRRTKYETRRLQERMKELWDLGWDDDETKEALGVNSKDYHYHRKQVLIKYPHFRRTRCAGKPFWIWNNEHDKILSGQCCFNHIVGLPEKNGKAMPLFDYEEKIFDELGRLDKDGNKNRHLWIKKATGLGVTEFVLRYMAWLCYSSDEYRNAQMCVVTGPNIELAKGLIARLKQICKPIEEIKSKETAIVLNGCRVEAYPSHHLDAMRSLPNPKFIFLDEADFFPLKEQKNARDVAERYIAKSDPYIVMVSTPNLPGGLYETIEKELEEKCIYRRLFLPYRVGLGRIYTTEEIEKAKASPSFEREYNLKYGHGIGNIFPYQLVNACIGEYDLTLKRQSSRVLAVDPAYGSSNFAIVGVEKVDEMLYVKEARQYERPAPSAMLDVVSDLAKRYRTVVVDSAHPGLIRDLQGRGVNAQAINFGKELQAMTMLAAQAVQERTIKIHTAFSDLAYQLKAATFNERGNPDKRNLNFDLGDSLLMAIYYLRGDNELFIARI